MLVNLNNTPNLAKIIHFVHKSLVCVAGRSDISWAAEAPSFGQIDWLLLSG